MHRTRPGGLNGGEMYGTRAGLPILLLLSENVRETSMVGRIYGKGKFCI